MRILFQVSYILLLIFISIWQLSCNNSNEENKEYSEEKAGEHVMLPTLTIEGKDIWVRSEPTKGEVVMKLNSGDVCEVLEKGKFEKIREMQDYWYKIQFNGKKGWVYGAQTSVKKEVLSENQVKATGTTAITGSSIQELLNKITESIKSVDTKYAEENQCMVESKLKLVNEKNNYAFINVERQECGAVCTTTNYSFLIFKQDDVWKIKSKFEGVFKSIHQSDSKNLQLIVLENMDQAHFWQKNSYKNIYLFDNYSLDLIELNLKAESCEIVSPKNISCDYCKDNTSYIEEFIFTSNPVTEVQKKITEIKYDSNNECEILKTETFTENYQWVSEDKIFSLINS